MLLLGGNFGTFRFSRTGKTFSILVVYAWYNGMSPEIYGLSNIYATLRTVGLSACESFIPVFC